SQAGGSFLGVISQEAVNANLPDFIEAMRGPRLAEFFKGRPVLARLIATALDQWMMATSEFISRFHNDRQDRILPLTKSSDPGRVQVIKASLSDLHKEGRSVYQLTFEDGTNIGYKPKSLDIDGAWATFLAWLDADGAPPSAGAPKVVCCNDYGWVEWVAARDCETAHEADEFFYRSGATLCLVRMLQGNDFHFENTIACGPVPVPIDLETIMVARQKHMDDIPPEGEAITKAFSKLEDSVMTTGYLPGWTSVPGGGAVLLGGLDAHETLMSRANGSIAVEQKGNVPRLNGTQLRLMDYSDTLIAGYQAMFDYLKKRGAVIAAEGGPLELFSGLRFRAVLRATRLYGFLQQRALGRRSVGDGVAWSQNFDFLYRSSVTAEGQNPLAQLCDYETECMSGYNIPFYEGETDSTQLICGDGTIVPDFFRQSCMVDIRGRLTAMTDDVLDFDLMIIRQSLSTTTIATDCIGCVEATDEQVTNENLVSVAGSLADRIEASSISGENSRTWLCPTPVTADERAVQLQPLGNTFLGGTMGIAMLNAALFKVTGDEARREAAMMEIAGVLAAMRKPEAAKATASVTPLGLTSGHGGALYALVALAKLLDDPELLDAAEAYARMIEPSRFQGSEDAGLSNGIAGALIGLTALHQHRPMPECEDVIAAAAKALLKNRTKVTELGECWRDRTWRIPQMGMMHGASGIALALSRAGWALNESTWTEAGIDGLASEAAMLQRFGYWPDLRDIAELKDDTKTVAAYGYSNGAAGIGLARLAMSDQLRASEYANDLDAALEQTHILGPTNNDGVFSGRFGRLAFLTEVALHRDDETLLLKVNRETKTILSAAEAAGHFHWRLGTDGQNPTLFDGAAGVGMCLLRMARPDIIPNIWAFEI
ncbi:MAG: type 2 lanthipeptide synthetase LanM family protein, partial [Pseudomonadota bacterium]